MRPIAFIVAALSGGGALTLGHVYLGRLEAEVGGGPRTTIVVATEDISVGATLTAKMLGTRELPQAYLERRHVPVAELGKIVGTRVTAGLQAGEALLRTDLARYAADLRVLSALVPRGMRAIAIRTERGGFDGLLRPGDRIDLLYSDEAHEGRDVTRTLLQNLMVLAVGQHLGGDSDEARFPSTIRGGGVTVSATIEQAQLITEALRHGRITVALRNSDDIAISGVPPATTLSESAAAPRKAATARPPSRETQPVEKISNVR